MIDAYLVGVSSLYEGEDIEVIYSIFQDERLLKKETVLMNYQTPAVVGQYALLTLLKELENHKDEEIIIRVNDAALLEVVRGVSTTKNVDIQKMGRKTREQLKKFPHCVIKDVGKDHTELARWKEVLKP